MLPFLVITVIAVLLLYGYYSMKKLDAYLSEDKTEQTQNLLRVAVEYTGLEIVIQSELEKLALQYPDYRLLIFGGTKQHILSLLQRNEADLALLSGINRCAPLRCFVREYPSEQLSPESGDSSDESTDIGQEVTIVWNDTGNNEILKAFTALFSDDNSDISIQS